MQNGQLNAVILQAADWAAFRRRHFQDHALRVYAAKDAPWYIFNDLQPLKSVEWRGCALDKTVLEKKAHWASIEKNLSMVNHQKILVDLYKTARTRSLRGVYKTF